MSTMTAPEEGMVFYTTPPQVFAGLLRGALKGIGVLIILKAHAAESMVKSGA